MLIVVEKLLLHTERETGPSERQAPVEFIVSL